MSDFMDKIGGCYIKLIIIALVVAWVTNFLGQPSLFLGWLGIGKWGDAYYDGSNGLTTGEQAEYDNEIEEFFSTAKQKLNLKVKSLLNEYLELDKRFNNINNQITSIEKDIKKHIQEYKNNPSTTNYNNINILHGQLIENHNQLVEINTQIENIDVELVQLKKNIIIEYIDQEYEAEDKSKINDDFIRYSKEVKSYKVERKDTMVSDRSKSKPKINVYDERILIIPKDLTESIKNLDDKIETLTKDVNSVVYTITYMQENSSVFLGENQACWYILGTKNELEALNVVHVKSLLSWNYSVDLNEEGMFDKSRFFQGDKGKISKIPIPVDCRSRYEILTKHPNGSYEKKPEYIKIINQNRFWSKTDFLVILLKRKE
ncbi:MAG: hypothetical protein IJY31_07720 [Muribaculaceae bacterium]|nr:hypothetical protein [Muribaculaceae bacterium]